MVVLVRGGRAPARGRGSAHTGVARLHVVVLVSGGSTRALGSERTRSVRSNPWKARGMVDIDTPDRKLGRASGRLEVGPHLGGGER